MIELLRFLEKFELWGYIILSVIGFIYFQKLVQAFSDWRQAVFGLERESAQRRISSALTVLALLLIIAVAEFTIISFIAPSYPWAGNLPTATMDLLATPTTTVESDTTRTGDIYYPTPEITAALENETDDTNENSDGCIPDVIQWSYPEPNTEISGIVELQGTVNVPDLGFYKYEYSQPGSDTWNTIAAGNQIKIDEPLGGAWNTEQLIPGDYSLRLVIANSQNELLAPCIIPVRIISP